MVTHNFIKLLPFLFDMNTSVSDQSSLMTYTQQVLCCQVSSISYILTMQVEASLINSPKNS